MMLECKGLNKNQIIFDQFPQIMYATFFFSELR